jgi:photosystem II stability/assembly factor-like uncharacterized protein
MKYRISVRISLLLILFFLSEYSSAQTGWYPLSPGFSNTIRAVFFINSQTGWFVGDNGTIKKSINGGLNWGTQTSGADAHQTGICFVNSTTGYICEYWTGILKTTNSGTDWLWRPLAQFGNTFNYISFANPSIGWTIGNQGIIYKTTNAGDNWFQQTSGTTNDLHTIILLDQNTGWIVGNGGKILKTINGGSSWTNQNSGSSSSLYSLYFFDALTGYACGTGGTLLYTNDGGGTWYHSNSGVTFQLNSIVFVNQNTGWMVGNASSGNVIKTTNGGLNWFAQNSNTSQGLLNVFFVDANTGFAVGNNGAIIKTTTGGNITNINIVSTKIPSEYSLSQNYPNPFNPTTVISFRLPVDGQISLNIFDMLGREISTLVNEKLAPGTYTVDWNASGYSSGVYFYSLQTVGYSDTKKMLLIRYGHLSYHFC